MSENGNKNWMEYLRLLTPMGIFVVGIYVSMINNGLNEVKESIKCLDSKMFIHLTNDEIHTPKTIAITRAEFDVYQNMRDQQMSDMKELLLEIRQDIKQGIK